MFKFSMSVFLIFIISAFTFITKLFPQTENYARHQLKYLLNGIIEITDPLTGLSAAYDIKDEKIFRENSIEPLIIRLSEIDSIEFADNFKLLGTIPLAGFYDPLLVIDSDMDGKKEIIGQYREPDWQVSFREIRYYENDAQGYYNLVANLDIGLPYDGRDIDNDGLPNVLFQYSQVLRFYESPDSFSYATQKIWEHRMWEGSAQVSNVTVADLDNDGHKDILYRGDQVGPDSNDYSVRSYIIEHVSGDTLYKKVFSID